MRSDPTRGSRQALNLTPASVRPARSQLSASWRLAQSGGSRYRVPSP